MNAFFPLFVDISQIRTIVVGGGAVAERRIKVLGQFGAQITVIAPQITEELQKLAGYGQLRWLKRSYRSGDFEDPQIGLAIVATDQREVNRQAGKEAKLAGIPVSVADCKEESTFYFPGIAKKDEMVIGITASGQNHKKAARITQKIRDLLEEDSK